MSDGKQPAEPIEKVRTILQEYEGKYSRSAKRWKLSYRVLLVVSAVFSTSSALIGKLEYFKFNASGLNSDVAAILAALVAVITTLIAALDFEVNWRVNRRSRHEVDVIALESEKTGADVNVLLSDLQEVVKRRNDDLNKQD